MYHEPTRDVEIILDVSESLSYEKEKESLASVTVNGIWIKEKTPEKNYIIKSSKYDNFYLVNVSIRIVI